MPKDYVKEQLSQSEEKGPEDFSKEKGLRAYKSLPFPNAQITFKDKNNIIIYTRNSMDGVGDAMHLYHFGTETERFAKKNGYNVIGILECQPSLPLTSNRTHQSILQSIAKSFKIHSFDKLYVLLDIGGYDIFTEEVLSADPAEIVDLFNREGAIHAIEFVVKNALSPFYIQDCEKACLCLTIDAGSGAVVPISLPSQVKNITIQEYRAGVIAGKPYADDTDSAPMDLQKISKNVDCYGIPLHPFIKQTNLQKAQRLCTFKDQRFLQLLLRQEHPTLINAQTYFEETMLFPGYLQSFGSVSVFVGAHVFKYLTPEGQLLKNCDFYLNRVGVDEKMIASVLKRFTQNPVYFIRPEKEAPTYISATFPCIRIFYGFFLENDDYRSLYTLTEGGAGLSGDNSCSQVFSSNNLPFAMAFHPSSMFLSNFWDHFHEFVSSFTNSEKENDYQFNKLCLYFKKLCKAGEKHDLHSLRSSPIGLAQHEEVLCRNIQEIGTLLKDPKLQKEWVEFRTMLEKDYNYSKNFQDFILKGALYVASKELKNRQSVSESLHNNNASSETLDYPTNMQKFGSQLMLWSFRPSQDIPGQHLVRANSVYRVK